MNPNEISFVMHTPQGDVTMHVLFTFFSEETGANYMLYTPDDANSGKPVALSACRYAPLHIMADTFSPQMLNGFHRGFLPYWRPCLRCSASRAALTETLMTL